jgi:hypothetical protein
MINLPTNNRTGLIMRITIFICCLFLGSGLCASAQEALRVQAGTTMRSAGGSFIVLNNTQLVNHGTVTQPSGGGTLKFSGSSDAGLSGSGTTLLNVMELALGSANQLNLLSNISIATGLNFSGGLLNLNNSVIDLGTGGQLSGESESSRAFTTGTGYIEATANLGAPASANPGNLGAVISSSSNMGSTVVRRGHRSQINSYGNGKSILRYYDISPANNSSLNATLRFLYFDAELNGLDEAALGLWRSTTNVNWTYVGSDSRDASSNYVEKGGIAAFSRWTLSTPAGALPLSFTTVNAACLNGAVRISWSTSSEQLVSRFDIERTSGVNDWTVAGSVAAAGTGTNSYAFTDAAPPPNAVYRVVGYDIDGKKTYSSFVRSSCQGAPGIFAYPNPVATVANISIYSASAADVKIMLYDAKGALVYWQQHAVNAGTSVLQLPMHRFAQGSYLLNVLWNGRTETVRLVKE